MMRVEARLFPSTEEEAQQAKAAMERFKSEILAPLGVNVDELPVFDGYAGELVDHGVFCPPKYGGTGNAMVEIPARRVVQIGGREDHYWG